jgi:hypothetical protein
VPRRTAVLLVGCLGLFAAGAAGAQTTSTTSASSTSSSSTSSTSTLPSASSTTSTTVANPCTGQPCTAAPPAAFLSAAAGEVRLDMTGSCWLDPVPGAQGQLHHCVTALLANDPGATLVVQAGETLSLRFDTAMSPTQAAFTADDKTTALAATNPTTFKADFAPGSHTVIVNTQWLQGDSGYRVSLDVRAAAPPPATPQTGPISLTG